MKNIVTGMEQAFKVEHNMPPQLVEGYFADQLSEASYFLSMKQITLAV